METLKKQIIDLYEIEKDSIEKLPDNGEIYTCNYGSNEYILRISKRISAEGQKAETRWVNYLFNNGINVSNPVSSKNNEFVEQIILKDTSYSAVLFNKAKGQIPSTNEWNSTLFIKCGETIAKMHNLSELNNGKENRVIINDWHIQDEYDTEKYIPSNSQKLREKCNKIFKQINSLPKNNQTYGVIHSDICLGNFFIHEDEITFFDFQDCEQHYFINDLAIFIYFAIYNSFNGEDINSYAEQMISSLLKGYMKERKLDIFWVNQIPLFMKLREILSINQIYCYENVDKLNDDYRILMNIYRRNIENDIPVIDINFESIWENIKAN